jgi:endonuclease YncB( thermonuclease family)
MKRLILVVAIIVSSFVSADASSLFGKVIEVNSGDVITITNLNRPVRVKLMGVDAPEMNQAFGDVARKHLSDLVFEKSVVVEYAGIAADSSLTGRVLLNDADIGAQMIRDGAAWFDPSNGNRLSPTNQEVYQQSEQAARGERRGLWQDENPVAPWEFMKAEATRRNPPAKEAVAEAKPRRSGPVPELSNLSLIAARMNAAPPPGPSSMSEENLDWARSTTRKNWSILQPPGEDFSINIPEGGDRRKMSVPMAGETVEINMYMVRDGWGVYSLLWYKGPSLGESDDLASGSLMKDFLKGAAEGYKRGSGDTNFKCDPRSRKIPASNGYTGLEFDLTSCPVPSRIRLYTKVIDGQRQVYVATAAYSEEESENATRFLKSFTVGRVSTVTR